MTHALKAAAIAALILPGAGVAAATAGDVAGTSEAEIVAFLTAEGYDVIDTDVSGDEFEAEVSRDGMNFEIDVSLESGRIEAIELDDD